MGILIVIVMNSDLSCQMHQHSVEMGLKFPATLKDEDLLRGRECRVLCQDPHQTYVSVRSKAKAQCGSLYID
jgi:hypothetical protein